MITVGEIELYDSLRNKLGDKEAQTLVSFIKTETKDNFDQQKGIFLTKDDKVDIMRAIYLVSFAQFVGIVAAVLAITKM